MNIKNVIADIVRTQADMTFAEHREWMRQSQPEGCQCDPEEWTREWRPICQEYNAVGFNAPCDTCEHDRECHE